jgi:lipoprotein-anchoring transpeptidase ErfK/SrfK
MRRLVAVPLKTAAVGTLVLAGTLYVAADARQVVIRQRQAELVRIEENAAKQPANLNQISNSRTAANRSLASNDLAPATSLPSADSQTKTSEQAKAELAAEQLAAQLPAEKPAPKKDGHTRQIVISIADRKLALIEDGRSVKTYAIAVGARYTPSPDGDFTVINHAQNPTYRHKGKEILPGKDNPLGTRWIGLSLKGYGIHGTNVPSSIGKAASHGCFRMGKEDVEDLYSRVQVGDTVSVRRERDAMIAQVFPSDALPNEAQPAVKTVTAEVQVATASIAPASVSGAAAQQ